MKAIIFDSSTIISLSMNGMTDMLKDLKLIFPGKFIISTQVKREVIDVPLTIKKFRLGALRVKQLVEDNVLESPESIGIPISDVNKKTQEILKQANKIFMTENEFIKIIHEGEASCLAISQLAYKKGIDNIIAIDERTTRMLVEKPKNLKDLLKRKLHHSVIMKNKPLKLESRIIRSTELAYVAYKKGLISMKDGILDALLYATKFRGAAISDQEIEQIKKIQ